MSVGSTYKLRVGVPRSLAISGKTRTRDEFFEWAWRELGSLGLLGVHEGTLLSEEAAEAGMETDSWTVDAGEAPRERDWVAAQSDSTSELYFENEKAARKAEEWLKAEAPGLKFLGIREQKNQDWDAEWKASFTGATVPPFWRVLPPWSTEKAAPGEIILRVNPGAGFGTGTHETTQLCLQALGEFSKKRDFTKIRALDFGSGSGILAIGAALLGARVEGVEIDPLAIDNALENTRLNSLEPRVSYSQTLDPAPFRYPLVIANILKPVLLQFVNDLTSRLAPNGQLVLSGLIDSDVADVSRAYSMALGGKVPEVRKLGEWRALLWDMSSEKS